MHHGEGARPRTSERLRSLAEAPGESLRFADLLEVLGDRAFGALLLVFALPNCLPLPALPGLSTVMALPLVILSAQLLLGRRQPGLPRWLGERRLRRADLARMVERLMPALLRLERALRPRWPALSGARAERGLGLVCLLLSLSLALPIPMANLFTGWSVLVIAIGLVEDDGLLIGAGLVMAMLALATATAVSLAWLEGAEWIWRLWAPAG